MTVVLVNESIDISSRHSLWSVYLGMRWGITPKLASGDCLKIIITLVPCFDALFIMELRGKFFLKWSLHQLDVFRGSVFFLSWRIFLWKFMGSSIQVYLINLHIIICDTYCCQFSCKNIINMLNICCWFFWCSSGCLWLFSCYYQKQWIEWSCTGTDCWCNRTECCKLHCVVSLFIFYSVWE